MVQVDANGRIRAINAAFEQWTGWSDAELRGKGVATVVQPAPTPPPSPVHGPSAEGHLGPLSGGTVLVRTRANQFLLAEWSWILCGGSNGWMQFQPVSALQSATEQRGIEAERARVILESIGDAVLTTDAAGRVDYMNPAAEALTGWRLAEARNRPVEEVFQIFHEETRQPAESPVSRVLREGVVVGLGNHTVLRRKDGREISISDAGAPIWDPQGRLSGVVLVFRDQSAERNWQRHREAERNLLEKHAAGLDLHVWLEDLCRAYEKLHPEALCSLLWVQDGRLYTAAAPSLPEGYNRAIQGARIGPQAGSCGTAAWRKQRVIVSDIAQDPLWHGWAEVAAQYGLAACWSFPILDRRDQVLGTFAVYYRTARGPEPQELDTLERWARLAGLVIEHQRMMKELQEREAQLAEAQARAHLGSWELNLLTGRGQWSAEMARLHGWPVDQPAPTIEEFFCLVHPNDQERMRSIHRRIAETRAPFVVEYRTHPDRGPVRHIQARVELIRNAEGQPMRLTGTSLDITDRVRLEAALRQSEEQFRRLITFAPEAIVLLDVATSRFVLVNPAAERLFKLPARELLRRGPAELSPPLQSDGQPSVRKFHQYVASALAGELPVFEWTYRDAEGRAVSCEVRLLRLEFDGKTVVRGSILDITERKVAEERIQKLARAHQLRSEISQLVVREADPAMLLENVCRRAVQMADLQAMVIARCGQDDTPCEILAMATPLHWELPWIQQACRLAAHNASGNEAQRLDPASLSDKLGVSKLDAEWLRTMEMHAAECFPIREEPRTSLFLFVFARAHSYFDAQTRQLFADIASDLAFALESHEKERQRRAAVERLRQNEERFRLLIENASDLITVLDREGIIHYQSPSVTRLLGYDPTHLQGGSVFEFVHEADRAVVQQALERVVTQSDRLPVTATFRIRHANDSWHVLEAIGRFVPDLLPGGGVVVNSRDITEIRQLQEQLRQAQKLEAIGRLAGGVAHDFNNILSVVMMQTELMAMAENLTPEISEGVAQIRAAAERAAALTRQLLLFSRKQVMQPRELDLNDVVATLVKMIQRIIGEDIHLQLRLLPQPLLLRADPGMLDQVLMNLVVNARDAMPQGGRLTLETDAVWITESGSGLPADLKPGRYAVLRVSDTGVGIPPEHLDRIFEPFFTTKEPGKGTGLGLSTVFGVAKQHGGTVTVTSTPGQGATFEVWLPLLDMPAAAEKVGGRVLPPGGTETILLVEDDESVRNLTRAILESAGYKVLTAAHGHEALQVWQSSGHAVDLVFTDLVMPGGISGRDLAARLLDEKPNLSVVYCTGYSAEIAGRELELQPGQALLTKPASPVEILQTVRRCLDARRLS